MSAELKPCPFCGGAPIAGPTATMYMVECNNAGCSANPDVMATFKNEAIAAWNRRAAPAQGALTDALSDEQIEDIMQPLMDNDGRVKMLAFARAIEQRIRGQVSDAADAARLDWLEEMANKPEGLLLHDGGDFTGRTGLGLRRIGRTLRQAIDQANPAAIQAQAGDAGGAA